MINISRYNRIVVSIDDFTIGKIKTFTPRPTDIDYKRGYMQRYFVQKSNDINSYIYEVDAQVFSDISNSPFMRPVVVKWKLSGDRDAVKEMNRKTIRFASLNMKSIGLYLPNLLQFHKEIK